MRVAVLMLPALVATVRAQEPVDFVREVAPILQQRCVSCHGPVKQKGDLRLDAREHLFTSDETEWKVRPKAPDDSELLRRVRLPLGDEDIMPNEGEPLTATQIATLVRWVESGADWPAAGDAYFVAAAKAAAVPRIDFEIAAPAPDVQARIDAALQALSERGAVAQRVAADTPAVEVNASLLGRAFGDDDLKQLTELAPVLVWLDLARTAVTDQGLAVLQPCQQLRRLNLSKTAVGDAGVQAIGPLPRLEVLNVYGSKVSDTAVPALQALPALRRVYAFESAVSAAGQAALLAARPEVALDRGEYAEERLRQAEAEAKARQERLRPVNTECPVLGKAIDGGQVVEHEGLRIAFCCEKCKKRFVDGPAEFAAKVAEYKEAKAKADAGKADPGKADPAKDAAKEPPKDAPKDAPKDPPK